MNARTLPVLLATAVLAGAGTLGTAAPAPVSAAGPAYVTIQFGRSIEGELHEPGMRAGSRHPSAGSGRGRSARARADVRRHGEHRSGQHDHRGLHRRRRLRQLGRPAQPQHDGRVRGHQRGPESPRHHPGNARTAAGGELRLAARLLQSGIHAGLERVRLPGRQVHHRHPDQHRQHLFLLWTAVQLHADHQRPIRDHGTVVRAG